MTEQRRPIRASERAREVVSGGLAEGERRRRGLLLPELRLRPEAPYIEIDEATSVVMTLSRLAAEESGALAIREPRGEPQAVVLSVERYLELAGKEINSTPKVGVEGRLVPNEAAFDRAHVEQVDSNESWFGQPPNTGA